MVETEQNQYLLAAEVGRLLHVSAKTVTRWAKDGKLPYSRTLGGHRRFPQGVIHELAGRLASESVTVDEIISQTPGGPDPLPPAR